ncbi:hypothetical protein G9A89_010030 [Geosiphon pyriformis]|nr:hypothetical protein G9A89_010030 [Geosiphon pyriformis]
MDGGTKNGGGGGGGGGGSGVGEYTGIDNTLNYPHFTKNTPERRMFLEASLLLKAESIELILLSKLSADR